MTRAKKVELWALQSPWLGLIISEPSTGITYTNQVGGTACAHPEIVGFMMPLPRNWLDGPRDVIDDQWNPEPTIGDVVLATRCLRAGDGHLYSRFAIQATRPGLIAEAWLPVVVLAADCAITGQFAGMEGVLTWNNSD